MKAQAVTIENPIRLKSFASDYCAGLDKEKTKEKTTQIAREIGELQELLYANSTHALLLIFQGLDASGKDGSVRTVLEFVTPVGVQASNFKVPTEEERAHDFLWRAHKVVPRFGYIGVFNRSHYEAVLAERVLGFASRQVCQQRYRQIVEWERMLTENKTVILKFYLHLSKKEQAERLQERIDNPHKHWKFGLGDLETRKLWDDYHVAYEDMINATSHPDARWHLIPADRNWYRNYLIACLTRDALKNLRLKWPRAKDDLSDVVIK